MDCRHRNADEAFWWVWALERHGAHWKRRGEREHAIVTRWVRFRVPCWCRHGQAFAANRSRA